MKPVRLLCYMFLLAFFGPDHAGTTFNSIPIILNLLTNRDIALIYSVTKLCTVRELPTFTTAPSFSTWMFAAFHNQFPLITMVQTATSRDKN